VSVQVGAGAKAVIPALLGKPPKPFNQQNKRRVSSGKLTLVYSANIARGRSAPLVNACQTFAISRQCDLNGMLWA
jgi:hypothetical protein